MPKPSRKTDIRVRPATLADLWAIVALEQVCFETDTWPPEIFAYYLPRKATFSAMAEMTGWADPAGYALGYMRKNGPVDLYALATHPDARGRGVGAALLQHVCAVAMTRPVAQVTLCVREDNHAAIRLYEAFGFAATAFKPGYYQDGASAIRMRLNLKP
jgi:ribosomal-protein-alanine N-acetyltransferase